MKKTGAVGIISCVLFLFLASACGKQMKRRAEKSWNPEGLWESASSAGDSAAQHPADHLSVAEEGIIGESCSEDGTVLGSFGIEYSYSYHIPKINANTPGAKAINQKIEALYGTDVKACMEAVRKKESPVFDTITYESFRFGEVLSLLICYHSNYYDGEQQYDSYHYDVKRGLELDHDDMLAVKGMTREAYRNAIRRAAVQYYDDQNYPAWAELLRYDPGAYQERRSWTISEKNVPDVSPLYLDHTGTLHAVAAIGSNVGPDFLYVPLSLEAGEDSRNVKMDHPLDFLTVTGSGRALSLCLQQTEYGESLFQKSSYLLYPPYGDVFPVHGLWNDYVSTFSAVVGEENMPIVFLLGRDGRVSYIDVLTGIKGGYCCADGPLFDVDRVTSFAADVNERGIPVAYAVREDGERVELNGRVAFDRQRMGNAFCGTWSCRYDHGTDESVDSSGTGSYTLTIQDGGRIQMSRWEDGQRAPEEFEGQLIRLGMMEQGLVYYYHAWQNPDDGFVIEGAIALETESDYREGASGSILRVTELGGMPFSGTATGETTCFEKIPDGS